MLNKLSASLFMIFMCVIGRVCSQESSKNELLLTAAAGLSFNTIDSEHLPDEARRIGFGGTVLLLWQPEYRLSVGVETGWLFMNSIKKATVSTQFGNTSIRSLWQTVPLLCIFGMKIHNNVTIYAGLGYYDIIAVNESFGTSIATSQMNAGLSGAMDYHIRIHEEAALGARFSLHNITELQQRLITLQISYRYSLLSW